MKRFYSVVVLFATLVFLPGCLEVKNEFVINPDGSGKVRHHVLFSPMQMKLGGKQLSGQEQLRQAVKKEISKSKGVDAWEDVSYKVKDNGTLSFTGTAYFSDISELELYNQGFNPIQKISRSEKSNGNITFERNPLDQIGFQTPRSSNNTGPELTEEQVQEKIEKKRQQFQKDKPMLSHIEEVQISNIFNLPAPVQSSTNVELDSPTRARVFVSGKKLVKAMETVISSDEMMREWVKQWKGLIFFPPPPLVNEVLFGEKGPVQFTISGTASPQFDYEQKVRQAKKETKKLKSKLGIESSVSNAGETSGTSGSGSLPDGDGGKYGVALKNKETMKANWGIAFLNQEDNELSLGFYPKTPKKSLIKSIREELSPHFFAEDLEEPYIQIEFDLKEGTSLSRDAVRSYDIHFMNFSEEPMSLHQSLTSMMEGVQLKLDGSFEKGGRIKGIFKGSQNSDSQDHDNIYTWDLKFNMKIR